MIMCIIIVLICYDNLLKSSLFTFYNWSVPIKYIFETVFWVGYKDNDKTQVQYKDKIEVMIWI